MSAILLSIVSELRSFTFKTVDRERITGDRMIDPVWRGMVHWHARQRNAEYERQQARKALRKFSRASPAGANLQQRFESLERKEAA